jgi:cytoskeletal protein CcmA (bactofilin family)
MGFSGFSRGKDQGQGGQGGPPPSTPTGGNLTAFIDQGSEFEGKLSFKDTVRIDGRFKGEIASENTLIVGESGEIEASIRSNTVVISGTVVGDVNAGRQIVLHKNAQVEGNLQTPSLVIEEGATLNGQITMTRADGKGKASASLKAIKGGPPEPGKPKDA